ncbi:EamA family transporter [Ligilactobacillus agilis]|uniref:EamA family transporter n=1 Tax=Ligilactobacillus agilis TaxID=1601 RepID=UPI00143799F6|nr:DMT family transporter [Ligilactobacillus agilis]GET10402.1 drug/metabolite transporter permease [Ligilactobacillus agilis]
MSEKKKGFSLAIIGCVFWGLSGNVAQDLFEQAHIGPMWLVGVRLLGAGLLLVTWSHLTLPTAKVKALKTRAYLPRLVCFALLGMIPSQLTYFLAIKHGNASSATILQFLGPLFIIIYLALKQLQWPRRVDIISIVVALAGTTLLVTNGNLNQLALEPLGLFWGIMAGVSQASYTLLPSKLLASFDAKLVVGWAMIIGGLCFIPTLITTKVAALSWLNLAEIAFIIVFGTMLSYLFYLKSTSYIAPATTGMLSAFEPLTASLVGLGLGTVHFTLIGILGACLVLSTAFLQSLASK